MKRTTIYLAGKMAGLSYDEMNGWRTEARGILEEHGLKILNPAVTGLDVITLPQEVPHHNKFQIDHSDLVLAEFNYNEISLGTYGEIMYASFVGKPVVLWGTSMHINHPWVRAHVSKIFDTWREAVPYVISHYKL